MYKTDTQELRKAMIDKNIITISDLSERSGVGRDTISKILDGKIQPSTAVMFKIAETLELDSSKAGNIFFSCNLRNA